MNSGSSYSLSLPKSFILIGNPGTGKTTLALGLPNPFILDCDGNLDGPVRFLQSTGRLQPKWFYDTPLKDKSGSPTPRPNRWDRATELLLEALNSPEVSTIVIDSLTSFVEFALDKVRSLQKRKFGDNKLTPDDPLQIQDWGVFAQIMKQFIFWLKSSGKTIVFTAHITVDKDDLTGALLNFLAIPGQLRTTLTGWFEEAWQCYIESEGAGASQKTVRKVRTVADSRSLNLGLKSSVGLPGSFSMDIDTILAKLQPSKP